MKRIIVLLLVLVLSCSLLASCDVLPDSVMDKLGPVLEKVGIDTGKDEEPAPEEPAHVHDFVLKETKPATCSKKGKETYECACGETKTVELTKDHNFELSKTVEPSCQGAGSRSYLCMDCGASKRETFGEKTDHTLSPFVESSRLIHCTTKGCSYAVMPEGTGKYTEVIVFKFTDADVAEFEAVYAELQAIIDAAAPYDKTLHAYTPGSETHTAYLAMEAKYEELYDILEYITAQYQIAQLEYRMDMTDENQAEVDNISKIRTDLVADFYSFSSPIAESMYREYYYEGMTDEEINAYVWESDTVANPEYTALVNRSNEIELEFYSLSNPTRGTEMPVLYSEFVDINNQLAQLLGYNNYLEYAYADIYGRDYTYQDAETIYNYVKEYITPIYNKLYEYWYYHGYTNETYGEKSFFEVYEQNNSLNNYIDLLTIKGNKTVSFSDEFNGLIGDGNCFRGEYAGAYVTSIYGLDLDGSDLPIAYFGEGYDTFTTVAHEFGHYMNEVYSGGKYNQSYDLLEMHSQGNEMLFLAYLNNNRGEIESSGLQYLNSYQPLNMFFAVVNPVAVDAFERAVYTDNYTGPNADTIMADGTITYDEYDLIYESILIDLGVDSRFRSTTYWRQVTITSACYYISYAVSALPVLQLLPMGIEDFDAASEAYLKLFSYVDEYENGADYMTTEETLEYAGLKSFMDEELYIYLNEYFMATNP